MGAVASARGLICGSCGARVDQGDEVCPRCGTDFRPKGRSIGETIHPVFEFLLLLWTLAFPIDCLITYVRYGNFGTLFAYAENVVGFAPWMTGVAVFFVLTYSTEPRGRY